jgi:hypothetical protein
VQNAMNVFGAAVRDWWESMVGLVTTNLLWLGLSVTIVLLGPATAGIQAVGHSIAQGQGQHLEDFTGAARRYLWLSQRWVLLNILVAALLYLNVSFYSSVTSPLAALIQALLISFALLWLAMQFYVWPFVLTQEDKRLRVALRNAAFLALASPVFTLSLLLQAALVIVLSLFTILPLAAFTTSFLAILSNRAVIERLTVFGKLPAPPSPPITGDPQ